MPEPDLEVLRARLSRVYSPTYEGGYGGTCYECPYASPPLRSDGTIADWDEVWNDPTEAYFRCSLPGRASSSIEWGEYAPCTAEEWVKGVLNA